MTGLTRREFLRISGTYGALLAFRSFDIFAPNSALEQKNQLNKESNFFQLDLPKDRGLLQTRQVETPASIANSVEIPVDQIINENGFAAGEEIPSGEFVIIPRQSGVHYVNEMNKDIRNRLVIRAVRNPELSIEQDFTDDELFQTNQLIRAVQPISDKYLGSDVSATKGFARVVRIPNLLGETPASAYAVERNPICKTSGRFADNDKVSSQVCPDRIRFIALSPVNSSLSTFGYLDEQRGGLARETFSKFVALDVLEEFLHLRLWKLKMNPFGDPDDSFSTHPLIKAIQSLGYEDLFRDSSSDFNLGLLGRDSVEWHLLKQWPEFFKEMMPLYFDYYNVGIAPDIVEVEGHIDKAYPVYRKWRQIYDSPLKPLQVGFEGRKLVWEKKISDDDFVVWATPAYSVRRPTIEEQYEGKWVLDPSYVPTQDKEDFVRYRSWRVSKPTRVMDGVPQEINTASAVAFFRESNELLYKNWDTTTDFSGSLIGSEPVAWWASERKTRFSEVE